jgi:hypothetical protein
MDDQWRGRTVLAVSVIATLSWVLGLFAGGYVVFLAVSGGNVTVVLAVALGGVALGATLSMVESRLSGEGPFGGG